MFGVKYLPSSNNNTIRGFTKDGFASEEEAETWIAEKHFCKLCKSAWDKFKLSGKSIPTEQFDRCLCEWLIYDVRENNEYEKKISITTDIVEKFIELLIFSGYEKKDIYESLKTLHKINEDDLTSASKSNKNDAVNIHANIAVVLHELIEKEKC